MSAVISRPRFLVRFLTWLPGLRTLAIDRRDCRLELHGEGPLRKGEAIVVAVHGTFARGAEWARPTSALMSAASQALGKGRCATFHWSGLNSARARIDAAHALAGELNKLPPDTDVSLISHSHGGNVVAWASTMLTHRLRAAVYMNTPFFQVRHNEYSTAGTFAMIMTAFLCWSLVEVLQPDAWRGTVGSSVTRLVLLGIALYWTSPTLTILTQLCQGKRETESEMALLSVGDEAGAGLTTNFTAQWLARWTFFAGLYVVAGVAAYDLLRGTPASEVWSFVTDWMTRGAYVLVAALLVGTFAVGLEHGAICFAHHVAITPTPTGRPMTFKTIQVPPTFGLRHSNLYTAEETIESVRTWLAATPSPHSQAGSTRAD